MAWVNQHSFKNDRKVRRATVLASYGGGFDNAAYCLTLFAVWSYFRKNKCNMNGYLAWKELLSPQTLLGPNAPFWYFGGIRGIHSDTMHAAAHGKINKVLDKASTVHKINNSLKGAVGIQLPKSVGVALATGTVSVNSHFLDPFFNQMTINQNLQIGMARANGIGDGAFVPDKHFLASGLSSDPVAQYAYASLYEFCKQVGFDPDAVGVMKTEKPDAPQFERWGDGSSQVAPAQWVPGIAPAM